jgi:large subunit ribosomal protein L18
VRSGKPRAVVRVTNKYVYVQIADAELRGDIVRAAASSKELAKMGWKGASGNIPAAYLTGTLAARRAIANGVKKAVLDIGLKSSTKGSKLFAVLKGLSDAGLEIPHSDDPLPAKERIAGAHISAYAKTLSSETDAYRKRFSGYLKRGLKPEEVSSHFEQVRQQIQSVPVGAKA